MSKHIPETDGIDHINIYSRAKTPLGCFLSNFCYSSLITGRTERKPILKRYINKQCYTI